MTTDDDDDDDTLLYHLCPPSSLNHISLLSHLNVRIRNHTVKFLPDAGASINILNPLNCGLLRLRLKPIQTTVKIPGNVMNALGQVTIKAEI